MSLIIEGMKMPEFRDVHSDGRGTVYLLMLTVNKDGTAYLHANTDDNEFHQVKELPTPHSRLIDADKLQTSIHGCLCETCETFSCEKGRGCLIEDVFNLLDEAPTVIKAEVSE